VAFLWGMSQSLPDQLRSTVRFLGRILGDVIRAEDGEAVFSQIEEIRQASVAFHREGTPEAARVMAERLGGLSLPDTVRFAHSFAVFLQITNIAEDQIQRRRGRAGDARPDTLAGALRSLKTEGVGTEAVGELLDRIRALGLLERSLLIFTADHGEGMGEHDYYFAHGEFLYNGQIQVPLILRLPGPAGERREVQVPVAQVDVLPTILDIARG